MSFTYNFGIAEISFKSSEYNKTAAFVSKPYEINGNVSRVSISSIEDHPVFEMDEASLISDRATSIEYYVSNLGYPALERWIPILPVNQNKVRNELLFFNENGIAKLNFKAKPIDAIVYRNGQRLDNKNDWVFIFGCDRVSIAFYDPSSDYTIDYVPAVDAHNVDFLMNTLTTTTEIFKGTDRNMAITLSHHPYVNYNTINTTPNYDPNLSVYKPIQVSLHNTDILGPNKIIIPTINPRIEESGIGTVNKTSYQVTEDVELSPYDVRNNLAIEYLHEGNKLYFTEQFNKANLIENRAYTHGNADIHVTYQYASSIIRVKIILRTTRLIGNQLRMTPVVKEFTLKAKIL